MDHFTGVGHIYVSDIINGLFVFGFVAGALAYAFGDVGWFGRQHWSIKVVIVIAAGAIIGAFLDHLVLPYIRTHRDIALIVLVGPFVVIVGVPFLLGVLSTCLIFPAWALAKAGRPSFFRWLTGIWERGGEALELMMGVSVAWLVILAAMSGSWIGYHFTLLLPVRRLLGLS